MARRSRRSETKSSPFQIQEFRNRRRKSARPRSGGTRSGPRKVLFEPLEPRVLLSGDLTFAALADGALTLRLDPADAGIIEIVETGTENVLASEQLVNLDGQSGYAVRIDGAGHDVDVTLDASVLGATEILDAGGVVFDGGSGVNTLLGADTPANWNVTGQGEGDIDGGKVRFSGIENLTGGAQADTFALATGGGVSGVISGGAGTDTLTGPDTDNVWNVTGADAGTLNTGAFEGIENLKGGDASDEFAFADGAGVSGTIDGGGGVDTLNYGAYGTGIDVDLATGEATGTAGIAAIANVTGGSGGDRLAGDASFNVLAGGAGDDVLVLGEGGDLLEGGLDSDTVVGDDADREWNVTGRDAGDVDDTDFSGIENLTGGSGADDFALWDGAFLTGTIDGGLGFNTLDFAAFTAAVQVELRAGSEIAGTISARNVRKLRGGQGGNQLYGSDDDHDWYLDGVDAGTVGSLEFEGIENLTGGDGADRFAFADGARITGTIDGGAGLDTLDLSYYSTDIVIDLSTGTVTGTGGIVGMEEVRGGAGGLTTLPEVVTPSSDDGLNGDDGLAHIADAAESAGSFVPEEVGDNLLSMIEVRGYVSRVVSSGLVTGVTIISHGFQILDSDGDSLAPLAQAINTVARGWLLDYDVGADGGQGGFHEEESILPSDNEFEAGELVLLFDWAPESNEMSAGWTEAAGDALFGLITGLGLVDPQAGTAVADLHFIAHSFGCAVISETTERLARYGVRVDHVTFLDPHDFDQAESPESSEDLRFDGAQAQSTLNRPDGYGVTVWDNVTFAEAYYQTRGKQFGPDGFVPEGRPIPGAYNVFMDAELPNDDRLFDPGWLGGDHSYIWRDYYVASVLKDYLAVRDGKLTEVDANGDGEPDVDLDGDGELSTFWLPGDIGSNSVSHYFSDTGYDLSRVAHRDELEALSYQERVDHLKALRPAMDNFFSSSIDDLQDHKHTPPLFWDHDTFQINQQGLFQIGRTEQELAENPWAPQWKPLEFVNGNFESTSLKGYQKVPGWSHHGGGGPHNSTLPTVNAENGNHFLSLNRVIKSRTHNRFYLPSGAAALSFKVLKSFWKPDYAADILQVSLGDTEIFGRSLDKLGTGSHVVEIPDTLRRQVHSPQVHTLTFKIVRSEPNNDAQKNGVDIDDVGLLPSLDLEYTATADVSLKLRLDPADSGFVEIVDVSTDEVLASGQMPVPVPGTASDYTVRIEGNGHDVGLILDDDVLDAIRSRGGKVDFVGGSGHESLDLNGDGTPTYWDITGDGEGRIARDTNGDGEGDIDGQRVSFSGIDDLTGGDQTDIFTLHRYGKVTGQIDGGDGKDIDGNDILDTLIGPNTPSFWNVTGHGVGDIEDHNNDKLVRFSGIEDLTGGAYADEFTLHSGGMATGQIDGGGGKNTLVGPTRDNYWRIITSDGWGDIAPLGHDPATAPVSFFMNFEKLTGGQNVDHFKLMFDYDGLSDNLDLIIDGSTGDNILEVENFDSSILECRKTGNHAGEIFDTEGTGKVSFQSIQHEKGFRGEIRTWDAALNAFVVTGFGGPLHYSNFNEHTRVIAANNLVTVSHEDGGVSTLEGFEHWKGGNKDDRFLLADLSFKGSINLGDGAGKDTLVTPDERTKTQITGTNDGFVVGAEVVLSSGVAASSVSALVPPTNIGGRNHDYFDRSPGSVESGGQITDSGSDGTSGIRFTGVENLQGGSEDDSFVLTDSVLTSMVIDGGGGYNTIDFQAYTTPVMVTITGRNQITGTATASNLQEVIGGQSADDHLYGSDANTKWSITGASGGTVADLAGVDPPELIFDGFEALHVGAGVDQFEVAAGVQFAGIIYAGGGSGDDDVLYGPDEGAEWYITGLNAGTLAGLPFEGFGNLVGGSGSDSFLFGSEGVLTGTIKGGDGTGTDTLQLASVPTQWAVDHQRVGRVGTDPDDPTLKFEAIEQLLNFVGQDFVAAELQDDLDQLGDRAAALGVAMPFLDQALDNLMGLAEGLDRLVMALGGVLGADGKTIDLPQSLGFGEDGVADSDAVSLTYDGGFLAFSVEFLQSQTTAGNITVNEDPLSDFTFYAEQITSSVDFSLTAGIDLGSGSVFLEEGSWAQGSLEVNQQGNVEGDARYGFLDVGVVGGSADVGLHYLLLMTDPDASDRGITLDNLEDPAGDLTSFVDSEVTGHAKFTLPLTASWSGLAVDGSLESTLEIFFDPTLESPVTPTRPENLDLRNFERINADAIVNQFSELAAWLDKLASVQLSTYDIPFIQDEIGDLFDFGALIRSSFLSKEATDDNGGLLEPGLIDADNRSTFASVQGFEAKLAAMFPSVTPGDPIVDYVGGVLQIHLGRLINSLDRLTASRGIPIAFDFDLGQVANVASESAILLESSFGIDEQFTLGIDLTDTVPGAQRNLVADKSLADLNLLDNFGSPPPDALPRNLGVTAEGAVISEGRLPGDATFRLEIDGQFYEVIVTQDSTEGRASTQFAGDQEFVGGWITVGSAIAKDTRVRYSNGGDISVGGLVNGREYVVDAYEVSDGESRVQLREVPGTTPLEPTAGGSETSHRLTWSTGNANADWLDLRDDLNTALEMNATPVEDGQLPVDLSQKVEAHYVSASGKFVLRSKNGVTSLGLVVDPVDPAARWLGFQSATAVQDNGNLAIEARQQARAVIGRLSADGELSLSVTKDGIERSFDLVIEQAATEANLSILDLVGDVSNALAATKWNASGDLTLGDILEVASDGNHLFIRAIGNDVEAFSAFSERLKFGTSDPVAADANDIVIELSNGSNYHVSLQGATTMADISAAIVLGTRHEETGKDQLEITFEGEVGLQLRDKTFVPVTLDRSGAVISNLNPWVFSITSRNGSPAGALLKILGVDASGSAAPDGLIVGGQLAGPKISDRVFVENSMLDGRLDLTMSEIVATATFGVLDVELRGAGTLGGDLTISMTDPDGTDGRLRFTEIIKSLNGGLSDLANVTLSGTANLELTPDPGFDLGAAAKVHVHLRSNPISDPVAQNADLLDLLFGEEGNAQNVWFEHDLGGYEGLGLDNGLSIDNLLDSLRGLADFLSRFEAFGFLSTDLPIIKSSINDLLGYADEYVEALDELESEGASTLQEFESRLERAFGWSDELFEIAPDGDVLKLTLKPHREIEESLSVSISDLGAGVLSGGADLKVAGEIGLQLDLGVPFEIDPDQPLDEQVLVYESTGLWGNLAADADDLEFRAGYGAFGLLIRDGRIRIGGKIPNEGDSDRLFEVGLDLGTGGKATLADIDFASQLDATLDGEFLATLPVYFPSDSFYADDIVVEASVDIDSSSFLDATIELVSPESLDDLLDGFDLSALNLIDKLALAGDGFDLLLKGIQEVLDGEVLGKPVPIIGDKLADGSEFIGDLREGFASFRRVLDETSDLYDDYESAEKVAQVLTTALDDYGSAEVALSSEEFYKQVSERMEWNLTLEGDLFDTESELRFDLGIPGLGLETDATLSGSSTWSLSLGFGVSKSDGFYLILGDDVELTLDIQANVEGIITGKLGFLQLDAKTIDNAMTGLALAIEIDLGADETLQFSEIASLDPTPTIAATAEANLQLTLGVTSDIGSAASGFPSILSDFVFKWGITELNDFASFQNGLETIAFTNVRIDIGSYISDVLGPLVSKVAEVTEPLQPIIDVITAPLPVISDLGKPLTLIDLAGMTGKVNADLIYAIADTISLVNQIAEMSGENVAIPVGNFVIFGELDGEASAGFQDIDFGSARSAGELGEQFEGLKDGLVDIGEFTKDLEEKGGDAGAIVTSRTDDDSPWEFPIIEDPSQIFGLLLGKDAVLIGYDMPALDFEFEWSQFFTIFGPLGVSINVEFYAHADFAFGYDTLGIRQYAESDFKNPLLVLNGLFISDDPKHAVFQNDEPELVFGGGVSASLELNLGVAKAGVGGGINAEVEFDLYDPDGDGRVRLGELAANVMNEWEYGKKALAPLAVFDIEGSMWAELFAYLKVDIFILTIDKEWKITPPLEILSFDVDFARPPVLATELPNGDLQLNIGKRASDRINDSEYRTEGEKIYVESVGDREVKVWSPEFGINEDKAQSYDVSGAIIATGGKKNDTIDLSGVTSTMIGFSIEGGEGDDTILTGAGNGEVDGGDGVDTITAGSGAAVIHGGQGNDIITGGSGDDVIHGDGGANVIDGGGGDDTIHGESGDHGQQLKGGSGDDTIYGGAVDETIEGGTGDDEIHGGDGLDTIDGGDGNDFIYAGTSTDPFGDTIHGGAGADRIFGTDKKDTISGDSGADIIEAYDGNDDVWGGAGNDAIYGGKGEDILFGEGGDDRIEGGLGIDILSGGTGDDTLDGGTEKDWIFGSYVYDSPSYGAFALPDEAPQALKDAFATEVARFDNAVSLQGNTRWDQFVQENGGDTIPTEVLSDDDTILVKQGDDVVDGQIGSDTYLIDFQKDLTPGTYETINVFDTGTVDEDTDALIVRGTDNDDEFFLRASYLDSGLAFVALVKRDDGGDTTAVQRLNYRRSLESLAVEGLAGDDRFAVDDTKAVVTLNGGVGDDSFQIGQLYKAPRDLDANVSAFDVFATVLTTRGFLSNGVSHDMTVNGGAGRDTFTVFHNEATLSLNGGAGDDSFYVKAFALAGSKAEARPRMDITGGAGADYIQYVVNAPVNIDGGDGYDTLVVVGTEFPDDFVVTERGIYGAGVTVNFVNLEAMTVDGAEGDDRFFVLGTGETFTASIAGGLGSDTFNVGGDAPPITSNDLLGHSGIIEHEVTSADRSADRPYDGLKVNGVAANVADDDAPGIRVTKSESSLVLTEGGEERSYSVVLTRRPTVNVTVTALAPVLPEDQRAKGEETIQFLVPDPNAEPDSARLVRRPSAALVFTPDNWDTEQTVTFLAPKDAATEGVFNGRINHTVSTSLPPIEGGMASATATSFTAKNNVTFSDDVVLRGRVLEVTSPDGRIQSRIIDGRDGNTLDLRGESWKYWKFDSQGEGPEAGTTFRIALPGADTIQADVDSWTAETLVAPGGTFAAGEESFSGLTVTVLSPSGVKQSRIVESRNGNTLHLRGDDWIVDPDDGSIFVIKRYDGLVIPTVEFQIQETGNSAEAGIMVRPTGHTTELSEGGSAEEYELALTRAPRDGSTVEVSLESLFGNLQLLDVESPDGDVLTNPVVLDADSLSARVTVAADDDDALEGFHKGYIGHTVSSADGTTTEAGQNAFAATSDGVTSVLLSHDIKVVAEGTATGASERTLQDDDANWEFDLAGHIVTIVDGTGRNQTRRIKSNTTNELVLWGETDGNAESVLYGTTDNDTDTGEKGRNWQVTPDDSSVYRIFAPVWIKLGTADDSGEEPPLLSVGEGRTTAISAHEYRLEANTVVFVGETVDDTGNVKLQAQSQNYGGRVDYSYEVAGYDGVYVERLRADISDNDAPGVRILESDGSTDVIETTTHADAGPGTPWQDSYKVVLTSEPTENVYVKVVPRPTPTSLVAVPPAVQLVVTANAADAPGFIDHGDGTLTLVFTEVNWHTAQTVEVAALDDTFVDGENIQVFASRLHTVGEIQGPLFLTGAGGLGSLAGLVEPALLARPVDGVDIYETNIKTPHGKVVQPAEGRTVAVEATTEFWEYLAEKELASERDLVGHSIEITSGTGHDQLPPFRMIEEAVLDGNVVTLTLNREWETPPDTTSKYALAEESATFFVNEAEQVDFLTVYDTDSFADKIGILEDATLDKQVQGFDSRIRGLGMGLDTVINGYNEPGGITYGGVEVTSINLGSGNDQFTVLSTSKRDRKLDTGTATSLTETPLADGTKLYELYDAQATFETTVGGLVGYRVEVTAKDTVTGAVLSVQTRTITFNTLQTLTVGSAWDSVSDVTVDVEYDYEIFEADARTWTMLQTGAGNDIVNVGLAADKDGGFSVDTQAGDDQVDADGGNYVDERGRATDDDGQPYTFAKTTLPFAAFGGEGEDTIHGGDGDDILFGDRGRVDYFAEDKVLVDRTPTSAANDLTATLTDDDAPFIGDLQGAWVRVKGSDGRVQTREISSNDNSVLTVKGAWDVGGIPDEGSTYEVFVEGRGAVATRLGTDPILEFATRNELPTLSVTGDDPRFIETRVGPPASSIAGWVYSRDLDETDSEGRGTLTVEHPVFPTENDGLVGMVVWLTDGAGHGQFRRVLANTATTLTLNAPFQIDVAKLDDPATAVSRFYVAGVPMDQADRVLRDPGRILTVNPEVGGVDTIFGGAGSDRILGGAGDDTLHGDDGDDVLVGDFADLDRVFDFEDPRAGATVRDTIVTTYTGMGAGDTISGNAGSDTVFGGFGDDTLYGDAETEGTTDGNDILLGDNGKIRFSAGVVAEIRTTDTVEETGGDDAISGNGADDVIFGGVGADTIHGGSDLPSELDGNDLVLGDQGIVIFDDDGDTSTLDRVETLDVHLGGADTIHGSGADDLILGGTAGDTLHGDGGADLAVGDHGRLTFSAGVLIRIETTETAEGGADVIYGGTEEDVLLGGAFGDRIDGGAADDLILGDNVNLERQETFGDTTSPRFRALQGTRIYDENGNPLVDEAPRHDPSRPRAENGEPQLPVWANWDLTMLHHTAADQTDDPRTYGHDFIAGGAANDTIFGQLGNDTIQGDGSIEIAAAASRTAEHGLTVVPSQEATSDGDDYIEGNGGDDVIFGNLGRDDIVGGSSNMFNLKALAQRPDGSDLIFGGAGTDLERNNHGDLTAEGHARDADMILGDNGNIYRLVGTNGTDARSFLEFNYDDYDVDGDPATEDLRIIPRAAKLLDYTPGGEYYDSDSAESDIGLADEIHGESGDDFIYGMVGNDVLFGEGQDDDLIGGYGHDWISGGAGYDGVLGDDGRIFTSRNVEKDGPHDEGFSEPLYGILKVDEVDKLIRTPGSIQQATINVDGQLKKTVDLTPFNLTPKGQTDDPRDPSEDANDIIYGGLGNDFLHGGAGDDAMSGAEALLEFYKKAVNPSDVLGYGDAGRDGEFAAYDEYDPRRRLFVSEDTNRPGVFTADHNGADAQEFLLNFDADDHYTPVPDNEDPNLATLNLVESGVQVQPGGDLIDVYTDGDDVMFGDLGNDWIVGGTGRDHLYGGWGDDLLNADDDHESTDHVPNHVDPRANNVPDTHASYEDIAYGGAGRDILIGNTGGDRLIDWAGEFNSYLVPFAPFGAFTISRAPQPHVYEYLYDLSEGDGADPTRSDDSGGDAARNGEPDGELGLVMQRDPAWRDQTGAPDDPQPGNIPGGRRDVLRSADFNDGHHNGFTPDTGTWSVESGRFSVAPEVLGQDAVSVYHVDHVLPGYFELRATINAVKALAGYDANTYLIFDYQSPTDFKFAGVNPKLNKLQMGHRTAEGWIVDVQNNMQLKEGNDYHMLLALNGTTATLVVDGTHDLTHVFDPRIDMYGDSHGLNQGMVGIGANNAKGNIDNVAVQVLPPEYTLEDTEDFSDGTADLFETSPAGDWTVQGDRYEADPSVGDRAVSLVDLGLESGLEAASILELKTTFDTDTAAGFVFDRYGPDDFKFVAVDVANDRVVIGHHTAKHGWVEDAVVDRAIASDVDHDLEVTLKGKTVSVTLDGQILPGHVFNALAVDGDFGLLARDGAASFASLTVKTDDPAFREEEPVYTGQPAPTTPEAVGTGSTGGTSSFGRAASGNDSFSSLSAGALGEAGAAQDWVDTGDVLDPVGTPDSDDDSENSGNVADASHRRGMGRRSATSGPDAKWAAQFDDWLVEEEV